MKVIVEFTINDEYLLDKHDRDHLGIDSDESEVRFLIEEEGLWGIVEDEYKILRVEPVEETPFRGQRRS